MPGRGRAVAYLLLGPPALSLLVLAAHFLRGGDLLPLLACIALLPLLAVPRPWATRVLQVALLLGAIEWIRTTGNTSTVIRRLRDQRLLDPVYCEVAETHGIETAIVTVCDFTGSKVLNYRFGQAHFVTNGGARFGMGKDGTDEFECGGWLEFPGPPFAICATNVN